MLAQFPNCFTVVYVFSKKFATKPVPHCPPHLKCVAALPCKIQKTEISEILLHLTQQQSLNVHKINKQRMQNNICIIVVKLNAQSPPFTHIHTQTFSPVIDCASSMMLCSKLCETSIRHCFSSSTS